MEQNSSGTVPLSSSASGWVKRITNILRTETVLHIDNLPPVSVFQVPRTISFRKPEAYAPQLIAMGPYHHLNPELYQMERDKLASIKEISTSPEQIFNFQALVIDRFREMDPYVRACYNKYMDFDQETLAWIVAIDGCFFLHIVKSYLDDDENVDRRLLDNTIITRDIMMLENQIPFIVLKEIRKVLEYVSNDEEEDVELVGMLLRMCESISPVKISVDNINPSALHMPLHLLDLMYRVIVNVVPDNESSSLTNDPVLEVSPLTSSLSAFSGFDSSSSKRSDNEKEEETGEVIHENLDEILDLVESSGTKRAQKIVRPVKVLSGIPWSSISGVFRKANLHVKDKNPSGREEEGDGEIGIPSVSYLWRYAKVQCRPFVGSIGEIRFAVEKNDHHQEEAILYLPVLNLNASAEVIFRNLVAYEAAASKSNLEFARYMNLMNGIVDTAEDVKLLKKNGVIKGSLKDEEIAEMFNGMRRCYVGFDDQKNKTNNIEIAIREMNRYYDKKLIVKVVKQLKRDLNASWKCMALVSTLALLILMSLQTFCDFYHCNGSMWKMD